MKLELKHLAGYLPYGLKYQKISKGNFNCDPDKTEVLNWCVNDVEDLFKLRYRVKSVKPILRPLSDLTNEDTIAIHGLGSIELELIDIEEWTEELIQEIKIRQKFKLSQFEYLFSKHFDIYGLIENNLAIDKNTIK